MFKAKAEDEIRQEVIADLKGDNKDYDVEKHKDQIDRIVQRRMKDEKFKDSVHQSKERKKKEIEALNEKVNELDPKGEKNKDKDKKGEFVTKDEFEKTIKQTSHRNKYSWMKDDEYNLVKREADSSNKSFEDTLKNNSIVKTYFQNIDLKKRQEGIIGAPSTMVDQEPPETEADKIAKSFDKNYPPGFDPKK